MPRQLSDEELIRESLRRVLASDDVSARGLGAKAQAARQLALLNGGRVEDGGRDRDVEAEDPMGDLWATELERRVRTQRATSRRQARSAQA